MPSLRRTASTPTVRSTPYASPALAARGNGHRRSSGSETTSRRVLADIEWWRVTEGQTDPGSEEAEDRFRGSADMVAFDLSLGAGIPITHVDGVDHPVDLPLPWVGSATVGLVEPPTEQFSTLSITPHTPTRRHLSPESTSSSLEASPEPEHALDRFGPSLPPLDLLSESIVIGAMPPRRLPTGRPLAPVITRSFTFADCLSLRDDHPTQYADFATSPLSSAPDFLN